MLTTGPPKMKDRFEHAKAAWNQHSVPVILRRKRTREGNPVLRIRLPRRHTNYGVLKGDKPQNRNPEYRSEGDFWEIPYSRLNDIVRILVAYYGQVILMQPVKHRQVCARACMEAAGFECECSCLGANHGSNNMDSSWFEVDDTYAVMYRDEEVSLRVISKK